jgi:hypothetical protein
VQIEIAGLVALGVHDDRNRGWVSAMGEGHSDLRFRRWWLGPATRSSGGRETHERAGVPWVTLL